MDCAIAIGASAGGVPALEALMAGLPADLPAALLVVLHVGAHTNRLPALLRRNSRLAIEHARHGDLMRSGQVPPGAA